MSNTMSKHDHKKTIIRTVVFFAILIAIASVLLYYFFFRGWRIKTFFSSTEKNYSSYPVSCSFDSYGDKTALIINEIKGNSINVYFKNKRIFRDKGSIKCCCLIGDSVYYIKDGTLFCKDLNSEELLEVKRKVKSFIYDTDTKALYSLSDNGTITFIDIDTGIEKEVCNDVLSFAYDGNEFLVVKSIKGSIGYYYQIVGINGEEKDVLKTNSDYSLGHVFGILNDYYYVSRSGKMLLISKIDKKEIEIDFGDFSAGYDAKAISMNGRIFVVLSYYQNGSIISSQQETDITGLWEIDENSFEKKKIRDGLFSEIYCVDNNIVVRSSDTYSVIDSTTYGITPLY